MAAEHDDHAGEGRRIATRYGKTSLSDQAGNGPGGRDEWEDCMGGERQHSGWLITWKTEGTMMTMARTGGDTQTVGLYARNSGEASA